MNGKINGRLQQVYTGHVWVNSRTCTACWACIEACPHGVLGKIDFLGHRHVILKKTETCTGCERKCIKKNENCTGCKKCIKACPHGVFSETLPEAFKKYVRNTDTMLE